MNNALDNCVSAYQGGSLYDFDNEILLNWYPQRVLLHSASARSLLELGIGHGLTTSIFARRFDRHVVLDGSSAVIDNFRAKHPQCAAQVVEAYFEEFDTEERFDLVVMGFVLEHVDDPLEILRRYRKFLTPQGRVFVAVPNSEALNRRLGHLAGVLDDMAELSAHDRLLGHRRLYNIDSLRSVVAQAGYRVDRVEGIYLKPFTTRQIISLQLEHKFIDALCHCGVNYPELSCGLLAEISPQ